MVFPVHAMKEVFAHHPNENASQYVLACATATLSQVSGDQEALSGETARLLWQMSPYTYSTLFGFESSRKFDTIAYTRRGRISKRREDPDRQSGAV